MRFISHFWTAFWLNLLAVGALQADTFGLFTYSVSGGSVTITDYPADAAGPVVVPESINGQPVNKIGDESFGGCQLITSVSLPSGVSEIGMSAFSGCTALQSINLPLAVDYVGSSAFHGCSSLTSIDIPSGVLMIWGNTFKGCLELSTVTLPPGIGSIGDNAFQGCWKLSAINLPSSVTSIGSQAFYGCSSLTAIFLPSGLSSIGSQAFQGCSSLSGIVLPSGITSIGASAFFGCSSLMEVVVPSSLTSIASYAFYDCASLEEVTIPASVTGIADSAFANCHSLVRADFLGNAPLLGTMVFNAASPTFLIHHIVGKSGFASIGWPVVDDVVSPVMAVAQPVGTSLINGRTKNFGSQHVGSDASLTFTIQNTGNEDLTGLTITKDGNHPADFEITSSPSAPVSGGGSATFTVRFSPSGTGTRSAIIHISNSDPTGDPYHIKLSGTGTLPGSEWPFNYLDNGTSILITGLASPVSGEWIIPSSISGKPVTGIGNNAFQGSVDLTRIVIPTSVTSIGSYAFAGCAALTTITIPSSITTIGTFAFHQCANLASANFEGNAPALGSSAFLGAASGFGIHFITGKTGYTNPTWRGYPCTDASISLNLRHGAAVPNGGSFEFGETIVGFGFMQTFTITNSGLYPMTGISVSATGANPSDFTVSTAPSSTASGSGGKTDFTIRFKPMAEGRRTAEIRIQSSDTTASPFRILLGGAGSVTGTYGMFTYVDQGASISIVGHTPNPSGAAVIPSAIAGKPVSSVWSGALANCAGLTSLSIPPSVTILGAGSFSGCAGLVNLVIPPTVSQVGSSAFAGCTGLNTVSLPDGLVYLGESAFNGCTGITQIVFPAGVGTLGDSVFEGCTGLAQLAFSSGVTNLGTATFRNCTALRSVQVPAGVTYLGSSVFAGCAGLKEVSIPAGLTEIGPYAFSGCPGLVSVILPSGLKKVWGWSFSGCSSLAFIAIPPAVTYIGPGAFENCSKLLSACFEGNAPSTTADIYNGLPAGFATYFYNDATGFSTPAWMGRPSVNLGARMAVKSWLLENGLPYDAGLKSDPNGDGVDLLTAYALHLDPHQNLAGMLPRPLLQGNQMKLTFRGNRADVTYGVEQSADLKVWTRDGVFLSPPDSGGFRTATVEVAGASRYLRVVLVH